MTQEYWRWPESRGTTPNVDWKKAGIITAGVDVGAVSSQAAVMCDGELFCYSNIRTGPDSAKSATSALERALEGTGMKASDIKYTVSTGYGRKNVPNAQAINEITCHTRGAHFMFGPSVRTIIDMGGQTAKAIRCNEWGHVEELFVNDKCATGMGRGIEIMADLMHIPIQDMGEMSLKVEKDPEPVSTTCYVFANTQAYALLRAGLKENEAMASYLFAVAYRLYTLAGRLKGHAVQEGVHVMKEVALTGGLAKNPGVAKRLERELGVTALTSKYDPQIAGAIGAALLAKSLAEKSGKTAAAGVR